MKSYKFESGEVAVLFTSEEYRTMKMMMKYDVSLPNYFSHTQRWSTKDIEELQNLLTHWRTSVRDLIGD